VANDGHSDKNRNKEQQKSGDEVDCGREKIVMYFSIMLLKGLDVWVGNRVASSRGSWSVLTPVELHLFCELYARAPSRSSDLTLETQGRKRPALGRNETQGRIFCPNPSRTSSYAPGAHTSNSYHKICH
jgi:hypothetical protein